MQPLDSHTLHRCPYCKSDAVRLRAPDGFARVECDNCGATGPHLGDEDTRLADRKDQAVKSWNFVARAVP